MKNFISATQLSFTHKKTPSFPATYLQIWCLCTIERVFSLCLWENEFSTTFFIFHIIYQKQINININAGSGKKENLCEIQVSHLNNWISVIILFRFAGKVNLLLSEKDVVVFLVYLFELTVLLFFHCFVIWKCSIMLLLYRIQTNTIVNEKTLSLIWIGFDATYTKYIRRATIDELERSGDLTKILFVYQ